MIVLSEYIAISAADKYPYLMWLLSFELVAMPSHVVQII